MILHLIIDMEVEKQDLNWPKTPETHIKERNWYGNHLGEFQDMISYTKEEETKKI